MRSIRPGERQPLPRIEQAHGSGGRENISSRADIDRRADVGDGEEFLGECRRQADAAVRGRNAGVVAGVQRNPVVGHELRERHRGVVLLFRAMHRRLRQDREGTRRRVPPGLAAGNCRDCDQGVTAVQEHKLVGQADDDPLRPAGRNIAPQILTGLQRLGPNASSMSIRT